MKVEVFMKSDLLLHFIIRGRFRTFPCSFEEKGTDTFLESKIKSLKNFLWLQQNFMFFAFFHLVSLPVALKVG